VRLAVRGLLVLVVAALAAQPGAAAPARARLVTRPTSAIFWNPQVGLLGTGNCLPRVDHCVGGAVERTTDGGSTYHVVLRTRRPVIEIATVGPQGAIALPASGRAWRTLDGGRTWHQVAYRPFFWATPRIALRFDAYYQGDTSKLALRVTHDGGRTFQRLVDPCNSTVTYNAYANPVTPKLWWIVCVGLPAGGTMEKAIFRTLDGGKTWHERAANLTPPRGTAHGGINFNGYPNGLAFARNGFGLLTESQGPLYVTRDGGQHFHGRPKVERPAGDVGRSAAAFSNGVGYVLLTAGFPARLVETHDFGRTWHVVRRWTS
jgi:photosystem II stability/assembly factor-like uncharacterized protein